MYEQFIKEWLLANQSRVYSVIVSTYQEKINDLKPSLFRKWLAKEIDIPEEKINLSSLNSALTRYKKKEAKNKKNSNLKIDSDHLNNSKSQSENFTFSSVENKAAQSRTTEL